MGHLYAAKHRYLGTSRWDCIANDDYVDDEREGDESDKCRACSDTGEIGEPAMIASKIIAVLLQCSSLLLLYCANKASVSN